MLLGLGMMAAKSIDWADGLDRITRAARRRVRFGRHAGNIE